MGILTAAAAVGLAVWRRRVELTTTRIVVAVSAMMLVVQLGAVYWAYFRVGVGAQGRHLFPCLVPALVLLRAGIEAVASERYRAYVPVALIYTVGFLDSVVWALVAVPAYLN